MAINKNKKVLFLSMGNCCCCQMAEAFVRHLSNDEVKAFSAGLSPCCIHPLAYEVMMEKGIDMSHHYSKGLEEINLKDVDVLVTLCEEAKDRYFSLSHIPQKYHWITVDPTKIEGSEEKRLEGFRELREQIKFRVRELLRQLQSI